jgi:Zn-dependent peptidase ImmA (M78 family)
MTVRVQVQPQMLRWALTRAALRADDLVRRFPKLSEWEAGEKQPTLKQLEDFANATHTAVGLLLLAEPPDEPVPIPDFRTMANTAIARPSPNLLDTVYLCEQRQEWFRDYALSNAGDPLPIVGSLSPSDDVMHAARILGEALAFGVEDRRAYSNWSEALRSLSENAENLGILVMISGVVGSNTHRGLNPEEFRGFALADDLAPVVFINGADTKAAQIFTLVHELAHVWIGETALSDTTAASIPTNDVERWCNEVAAEVLVPRTAIASEYQRTDDLTAELDRLARVFKVSTLVVLRRIRDVGADLPGDFSTLYADELQRVLSLRAGGSGGNFYNTQPVRVSKRFARAVIGSTLEGQTLYRDAFQLLGFKKHSTFVELAHSLGVGE